MTLYCLIIVTNRNIGTYHSSDKTGKALFYVAEAIHQETLWMISGKLSRTV